MTSSLTHSIHSHRYHSYLVRFWQSGPDGMWRVSAQKLQGGETLRFADLESMFAFLKAQAEGDENVGGENECDRDAADANAGKASHR